MLRWLSTILGAVCFVATFPAHAGARLSVEGPRFVLTTDDGKRLTSPDLVGAVLEMSDPEGRPVTARIDRVEPASERPTTLLHYISAKRSDGSFGPICPPDAKGRRAALPIAGHWDDAGHYVRDPNRWFLSCTLGSQAKCVVWGYDPWSPGPLGEDLSLWYQACQNLVRAAYDGRGVGYTRNGTSIDVWDTLGIQKPEPGPLASYTFEAGWGPTGAVCVARTRWRELLPLAVLLESAPRLRASPCDISEARRRGALLFNRSETN